MIPKTIHYCWFGRGKKPHLIRKCIKSWRKTMSDYTIKEWNEDNFDVNIIPFVAEAYKERKWAFVADYCRFYSCYNEGGIYLDTDVETFHTFDNLLKENFFAGTEVRNTSNGKFTTVDVSVFGCEKGHWFAKECLDFYLDKPFRLDDGSIPGDVVQVVATRCLENHGYVRKDMDQRINDVSVYSTQWFSNITQSEALTQKPFYSLHHFDGSWTDDSKKSALYRFCRRHDLLHIYRKMEHITLFIRRLK